MRNRENLLNRLNEYRENNKARMLHYDAKVRDELRLQMVEAYGGKCLHCGENDPVVLTLDHINDDPEFEYQLFGKSARGGYTLYRYLRKHGWPKDRFQLLCFNCNMRKEHKRRRDEMVETLGPAPEFKKITRKEARAKADHSVNSKSGFKGIWRDKFRDKWTARIRVDGKMIVFGRFDSIVDAAIAYREGVRKIFGDIPSLLSDEEIHRRAALLGEMPPKIINSASELGL